MLQHDVIYVISLAMKINHSLFNYNKADLHVCKHKNVFSGKCNYVDFHFLLIYYTLTISTHQNPF
jgi:hypothetical protein